VVYLADLLGEPGGALPGGIVERMMKCGKPSCRCNADPPQLRLTELLVQLDEVEIRRVERAEGWGT
jgi:hypothetical protein